MQDQDNVRAVRPFLDIAANDFDQLSRRDIFDGVLLVDDHGCVVSKAGRQSRAEESERTDGGAEPHNRTSKEISGVEKA
jgi:hypothetical protein